MTPDPNLPQAATALIQGIDQFVSDVLYPSAQADWQNVAQPYSEAQGYLDRAKNDFQSVAMGAAPLTPWLENLRQALARYLTVSSQLGKDGVPASQQLSAHLRDFLAKVNGFAGSLSGPGNWVMPAVTIGVGLLGLWAFSSMSKDQKERERQVDDALSDVDSSDPENQLDDYRDGPWSDEDDDPDSVDFGCLRRHRPGRRGRGVGHRMKRRRWPRGRRK